MVDRRTGRDTLPELAGSSDRTVHQPSTINHQPTFAWLLATHHGPVYRFLVRLCAGDRQEAEDLCQETFLRAFRAFDRLDGQANHRAWVYRIAYNNFLNDRRRRRRGEVRLDESVPAGR